MGLEDLLCMKPTSFDLSKSTLVITKLTTKLSSLVNLPFRGGY